MADGKTPKKLTKTRLGGMAERFKAPVLKTGVGASSPWVRIPLPPPAKFPTGIAVQLYIAAIAAVMLASRAWRYRQRYWSGWQ